MMEILNRTRIRAYKQGFDCVSNVSQPSRRAVGSIDYRLASANQTHLSNLRRMYGDRRRLGFSILVGSDFVTRGDCQLSENVTLRERGLMQTCPVVAGGMNLFIYLMVHII